TIAQADNGGAIRLVADDTNGTSREVMRTNYQGTIFNETAQDQDFRVEGISDSSLFILDAGLNVGSMGVSASGAYKFRVRGLGAGSSDYAFGAINASSTNLITARNDGRITVGDTSADPIATTGRLYILS